MSPATALSRATIRAGSKARSCSEPHGKTFFRHGDSHPRSDHPQDYFPLLLHTNCISLDMPKAYCFLLVNSVQQTLLAACCSISGQFGESLIPLPETSPNYRVLQGLGVLTAPHGMVCKEETQACTTATGFSLLHKPLFLKEGYLDKEAEL